jgi:hypothetical protein
MKPAAKVFLNNDLRVEPVSVINFPHHSAQGSVRTRLFWAVYLIAVSVASIGWLAFLSYCALALLGF